MTRVTYRIVEHDGGWAYFSNGAFSETFPTRDDAVAAAKAVAEEQRRPDEDTDILFEDEDYRWHLQTSRGDDRPETEVEE